DLRFLTTLFPDSLARRRKRQSASLRTSIHAGDRLCGDFYERNFRLACTLTGGPPVASTVFALSSLLSCSYLMHVRAAVDTDGLAGHEIAVVGSQKDHRTDQILRVLIALEATALATIGKLLGAGYAFLIGA